MLGIVNVDTAIIVTIQRVNDREHHLAVEETFPGIQNLVEGLLEAKAIADTGEYLIRIEPVFYGGSRQADIQVNVHKL